MKCHCDMIWPLRPAEARKIRTKECAVLTHDRGKAWAWAWDKGTKFRIAIGWTESDKESFFDYARRDDFFPVKLHAIRETKLSCHRIWLSEASKRLHLAGLFILVTLTLINVSVLILHVASLVNYGYLLQWKVNNGKKHFEAMITSA